MSPTADRLSLAGRRALVCGSTQGIGKACALMLAARGASVTLLARHPEALEKVRSELPTNHSQSHHAIQADFSDWELVHKHVSEALDGGPPVHILVNNTGGPPAGRAIEADPQQYLDAFSKHLICNQVLAQLVAPGMKAAGYGRIINIISTSVIAPIPGLGVSNTIRGAVANWARTIADELGPLGITVNNVLPGYTQTARLTSLLQGRAERSGSTLDEIEEGIRAGIPLRRLGDPIELGEVVAFLASPAAGYINGANLPVDGGRTAAQ